MISSTENYLSMLITGVCVNTYFKLITTKLPFSQEQVVYKINNNLHIYFLLSVWYHYTTNIIISNV